MTGHVLASAQDGVLTLTLNRPEKRNALTDAMYGALADAMEAAEQDPATRVIVFRGVGDGFTAGNDLSEFAASAGRLGQVQRFLAALLGATRPLVAAVHGRAVGIGLTMLLHCDHVVLAEDAQLSAPFVSLALVPEAGSGLLLPARIGHARAFAVFALGEVVSASDALAWGLANRVVPHDALWAAADEVAGRLARQPREAVAATKRLMRDAAALAVQMEAEGAVFRERLGSAEAREAFAAFAERRAPNFSVR